MVKSRLSSLVSPLILAVGLSVCHAAWAADAEADHGTQGEAKADTKDDAKEASIKPRLKPDMKGKTEAKTEGKSKDKSKDKGEADKGGGNVSMSELRDMIDQKIAEVRAKEGAPAVLRVSPHVPRAVRGKPRAPNAVVTSANDSHAASSPADKPSAPNEPGALGRDVHWAYTGDTGPDSWGRLKPEYQQCMTGKRQSPIDIRDGIPVQLDPIQFDYHATNFRVFDNGHTVQVNLDPGNSITVQGHRYDLQQIQFNRPSEERVNGHQYEMAAHFVHKDLDGKLAVLAILMDQGRANSQVQQIWNNLPLEKGLEQAATQSIDLRQMLPSDKRQYYTYMGSLTTPPCTEGVLWMVMKQPVGVSPEQVAVFSRLYPMNARPVQDTAGRLIKDGQSGWSPW